MTLAPKKDKRSDCSTRALMFKARVVAADAVIFWQSQTKKVV